jgi:hypothetical protein
MDQDEKVGAAIFFGSLAYLVAIFGYFIIWPAIRGT